MRARSQYLLYVCAAFLAAAPPAFAEDLVSVRIASLEAGIICPPTAMSTRPAPDTLAGTTYLIDEDPPFVARSRQVPAALGIGFGVKVRARSPEGIEPVTVIVSHPPMGESGTTRQSFETRISGGDGALTFYQFDHAYELVPGAWQFTALTKDTVLYSASFKVVPAEMVPELASVCGYLDLLS
jgi:hypothetical protein